MEHKHVCLTRIDPDDSFWFTDVYNAINKANGRRRLRIVEDYHTVHLKHDVTTNAAGHTFFEGHKYRRSDKLTTTVCAIWSTDASGHKHVRVDVRAIHHDADYKWERVNGKWARTPYPVELDASNTRFLAITQQVVETVSWEWTPFVWESDSRHKDALAFTKRIHDNPFDITTWLVYADWLDEQEAGELADTLARHIRLVFQPELALSVK